MKKMIGMVALCVFGLVVTSALAQIPEEPAAAPVAAPEAAVIVAPADPVAASPAAGIAPAAQEITIKGKVSVVNGPDGVLKFIFINPAEPGSHGYRVDIENGEGKTLVDKDGQIVEATGVDANRLFTIATITVVQ